AALSRGAGWPDQPGSGGEPCVSCLLSAEDNSADTIVPRLIACEADRGRIDIIDGVQRTEGEEWEHFNLLDDVRALERRIEGVGAKMCCVDPIAAFLGGTDSHKDASVRQALGPLAAMAERTGCAIVAVMHTNKSRGLRKVSDKVCGSVAFTNAARMAWFIVEDPDDEHRRLMLPYKYNIIERPDGMAFKIEDGAVRWLGPVDTRAEDVLTAGEADSSSTKAADASAWLEDYLAVGAVKAKDVEKAAKVEGISYITLRRAKDSLGVKSSCPGGVWHWELDRVEV
ncbi:MAG: AAA family ATPase, partial [Planctomycetes bacterium]|nr:AAA family ATPase [Planctomycetota bacterium]